MIPYSLLLIWVWIDVFHEEPDALSLNGSGAILPYLRKAVENFLLLTLWAVFYFWAVRVWPGRDNVFQAAGLLLFYTYSAGLSRRSLPSILMTYAAAFWLAQIQNPAQIPIEAFKSAVFVSGIAFAWCGVRHRLILFSIPKKIAGLPEFLLTAALISAALSFLWIR